MNPNLKRYILLSFIGLLCINNITKINGASILKLVKYNNEEPMDEPTNKHNYNQNNINNHININININKVNDTKNNKKINIDINNKNNKTTELINETNENQILNENKIQNNKVERLDSKETLGKNYTTIGNIVKQSIIYDKNINNFLGEVIIHYNNTYHNHHYCKINIVISEKINVMYIRKYIYSYIFSLLLKTDIQKYLFHPSYDQRTIQLVNYQCNFISST